MADVGDEAEAERDDCEVEQQGGGLLALRVGPGRGEGQRGGERRATGVDRVLRHDGEEEVRSRGEAGDESLVDPGALGQRAGEGARYRRRGEHQAHLLSATDDLAPCHDPSSCHVTNSHMGP